MAEEKEFGFRSLNLSSFDVLRQCEERGRQQCPGCQRSRMFYCYTCFSPLSPLADHCPKVTLPFFLDMYVFFFCIYCNLQFANNKR